MHKYYIHLLIYIYIYIHIIPYHTIPYNIISYYPRVRLGRCRTSSPDCLSIYLPIYLSLSIYTLRRRHRLLRGRLASGCMILHRVNITAAVYC